MPSAITLTASKMMSQENVRRRILRSISEDSPSFHNGMHNGWVLVFVCEQNLYNELDI